MLSTRNHSGRGEAKWFFLNLALPLSCLLVTASANPEPGAASATQVRGYLGVTLTEICPEVRSQTTLREGEGLLIGRVAPGSPAAVLGLRHYDILTQFNDQRLMSPAQFATLVENAGPEAEVDLTYLRRGTEVKGRIKLCRKPAATVPAAAVPPSNEEMLTSVIRALRDNPEMLQSVHRMVHGGEVGSALSGARITLKDEEGLVELTVVGPSQHVKAWDKKGKLFFDGPCSSPEELAAVPEALKPRLERLQKECHHKAPEDEPLESATPDSGP